MTEPTDAEIMLEASKVGGLFDDLAIGYQSEDILKFARAVLARRGQPSAAGEAAEHYRNAIASACEGWTMPDGLRKHLEAALWNPPTPQPTQAQAGAVPLTCEWAHNENDEFWESACGEAWRFDDGGPAENSMHFCHSCGKSLRIKGKEAGNADA